MSAPLVDYTALLNETYAVLQTKVPAQLLAPQVGIVCGSGLSSLAEKSMREMVLVPYSLLEGFGRSTGARTLR